MAEHESMKPDKIKEQAEESCTRRKTTQPLYDQLKAQDEGVVGFQFEPPIEKHAALLEGLYSDEQRANLVTRLQQSYGNAYVQRLLNSRAVQPELTVNPPDDVFEREADRVANTIQCQAEEEEEEPIQPKAISQVQRQEELPEEEEEEEEELIQGKSAEIQRQKGSEDLEAQINVARGGGQPLADSVRASLEPQFGYDFSQVRIHTDVEADRLSRRLEAEAFTTGKDVFFRDGAYQPESEGGTKLIAHELTHVVQQGAAAPALQRQAAAETEEEGGAEKALPPELSVWTVSKVTGEAGIEEAIVFEEGGVYYGPASLTLTPGQEVLAGTEIILGKNSSLTLTCGSTELRTSGGKEGNRFTLPSEFGSRIPETTVKLLIGKLWAALGGGAEWKEETTNATIGVRG